MPLNCVACSSPLESKELIKCSLCASTYHYLCINMTKENYSKLSVSYKSNWKCPTCKVVTKRGPQNTDSTPVKGADPVSSAECNVNKLTQDFQIFKDDILKSLCKSQEEQKRALLSLFDEKFKDIQQSLDFLSSTYDLVKQDLEVAKNDTHLLKKENEELRSDVKILKSRLSLFEKESRACNLEIHCVPEHRNENLINVIEQIGRITGSPIKDGQILKCTRIAKYNKESPRPRSVLVKFFSPLIRDNFYANILTFNKSKSNDEKLNTSHLGLAGEKRGIYIMEHLSPEAKALQAQARKFKKENSWQFVWSRNGNIFLRKNISSDVVYVKNEEVFRHLL
ncbi:uncharacterized protein LOC128198517 [Bicyclus anynana]|uniref:Uncharacterized protein LOC128198517 n=1 Tax=Bicyclus anynana TaxID=110368 RepID=A0ABM3LMN8_BICAN|nr:uncharacterized protein LOC128198517 [Bicyclus anynana]